MTTKSKRVLIFSEPFGSGHTRVATAILEDIRLHYPDWDAKVYEIGKELHPMRHHWFVNSYLKLLNISPRAWGHLYHFRQYRPMLPQLETMLYQVFYTKIYTFLKENQPDLIICTHPFPSAAISCLKRRGIRIPLYTVITDYGIHGSWISSGVDRYYVPTWKSYEKLRQLNIPKEKIWVSGLPVHPCFYQQTDQAIAREQLGLKQLPTLLCMGGGFGFGLSAKLLDALLPYQDQLQILIVAGKNQDLYEELAQHPLLKNSNAHLYGFVEQVNLLMDAADLILTKPGGVTCTEAIVKGIPLLFYHPLPGQEQENLQYFVNQGYGLEVKNEQHVAHLVAQYLNNASLNKQKPSTHHPTHHLRTLAATLL